MDADAGEEEAVLAAFWAAREAGQASAGCYRAGVAVWKMLHPDHSPEYAARVAVRIMLRSAFGEQAVLITAGAESGSTLDR
jgi:hypothetical protein